MKVEAVSEPRHTPGGATQILVRAGTKHFIVSSVVAFDTGRFETLVFPSTSEGEITDWCEVAGGRGYSPEEAIQDLENYLCALS